jgi:hypothetical protein
VSRVHEVAYLESLDWHTPPELRNEPQVVSFAADKDGVYQRIEGADGHRYSWAPWEQVWCDWRPWTSNPNVAEWSSLAEITVH